MESSPGVQILAVQCQVKLYLFLYLFLYLYSYYICNLLAVQCQVSCHSKLQNALVFVFVFVFLFIFVIISWRAECADPGEFRELKIQSQGFRESTHGCPNISHGSKTSLIGCDFNLLKKHFHWRKKTISLKLISSGTPPPVSSSDTSSEKSKHRKNDIFSIFAMFSFLEEMNVQ